MITPLDLDVSAAMKALVLALDLAGTFVFALSGALAGVNRRLDFFGIMVLSFAAGSFGGVTRDLLIGAAPPAAIGDWRYLAASLVAGVLTFFWHSTIERLRSADLLPLGSRIRRRLTLEYASRDELLACLDHLLDAAGNVSLMTTELKATLADHAAGNYRVLMNLCDELLAVAADREIPRLDEKLFLECFQQPARPKPVAAQVKKR